MFDIQHILVATDFGDCSRRALETAVFLATKHRAKVTVFHSYEIPTYGFESIYPGSVDYVVPIQEEAERQLAVVVAELRCKLPNVDSRLCFGPPWQSLLDVASALEVDLIVMGTHGRRGVSHALLGSVAEKTVRLSPVPVLAVPMDHRAQSTAAATADASISPT
jgi:nucleotide-binding universal stress UspA family protein